MVADLQYENMDWNIGHTVHFYHMKLVKQFKTILVLVNDIEGQLIWKLTRNSDFTAKVPAWDINGTMTSNFNTKLFN